MNEIKTVLGDDLNFWDECLSKKFKKDEKGLFFNQKMENEALKRIKFTESRRKNLSQVKPHMGTHMENENVNTNKDLNKKVICVI